MSKIYSINAQLFSFSQTLFNVHVQTFRDIFVIFYINLFIYFYFWEEEFDIGAINLLVLWEFTYKIMKIYKKIFANVSIYLFIKFAYLCDPWS